MAHVTGAPAPITVGGRELRMSPLTDKEYEEVNNWLRAKVIKTARAAFTDDMTPAERSEILQAAILASRSLTFVNATEMFELDRLEVMARVLHQGVVRNHPDVTIEWLKDEFKKNPDAMVEAIQVWSEVNIGDMIKKERPADGSPKALAPERHATKRSTPS